VKGALRDIALAAQRAARKMLGEQEAARLGQLVALEVARLLGGSRVYIPCCSSEILRARAAALHAKGLDTRTITQRLGISQRHARRLLSMPHHAPTSPGQPYNC